MFAALIPKVWYPEIPVGTVMTDVDVDRRSVIGSIIQLWIIHFHSLLDYRRVASKHEDHISKALEESIEVSGSSVFDVFVRSTRDRCDRDIPSSV